MTNSTIDPPRISKLAVTGAILLPFGLLLLILQIPISRTTSAVSPAWWQTSLNYILLGLGFIAPIAATILGFISIADIRKSNGSIYGLPLAVFVSLFYPVLLLDLLLITLGWSFLGTISSSSLIPLAWLMIVVMVDYFVVRFFWRKAALKS